MKKKILIFGGSGLLGSFLSSHLKNNYKIVTTSNQNKNSHYRVDLTDVKKTFNLLKKISPNIVINCVAYTDVDKCNINLNTAFEKNVVSIFNIVNSLKKMKKKAHLIQISTDQVYNQKKKKKISNEDQINFANNYGLTKYMGEKQIVNYKTSTILRTNFFGNSLKNIRDSYSDLLTKNLKNKKSFKIPTNVYFNPIHMKILSSLIEKIIKKKIFGTYNIGSKNGISQYKFVVLVAKKLKLKFNKIIKFKSNISIHRKPNGTIMDIKKIEKKLKIKIPKINKSINLLY